MIRTQKSFFTLLEMMIAIALLALLASAVAYPLSGMLSKHRFQQSVKNFLIHLKELQSLALNYNSDMGILLYCEQKKWICAPFTDEPVQLFKPFELKEVDELTLDQKKMSLPLTLNIFASGRISPKGVLVFKGKRDAMQIDLTSPLQIKVTKLIE